ncbi:hypothetical protein VTO73DRAFT_14931 [Trametes versicolor]
MDAALPPLPAFAPRTPCSGPLPLPRRPLPGAATNVYSPQVTHPNTYSISLSLVFRLGHTAAYNGGGSSAGESHGNWKSEVSFRGESSNKVPEAPRYLSGT